MNSNFPRRFCSKCERLLDEMNVTFHNVHRYIILKRDTRNDDDTYLGELGRLIHAQVTARRELVSHQRSHDSFNDARPSLRPNV